MKTLFFIAGKTSAGCLNGSLTKDGPWFQKGHDNRCGKYEGTYRNMLTPSADTIQTRRPVPHDTVLPDMPCGGVEGIAPGHSGSGERIRGYMHEISQCEPTRKGQGYQQCHDANRDDGPKGVAPTTMQSTIMPMIGAGDLPNEGPIRIQIRGDGAQCQGCCIQPGGAALLQAEYRSHPSHGHWNTFGKRRGNGTEGAVDEDMVVTVHGPQSSRFHAPVFGSFDDDTAR